MKTEVIYKRLLLDGTYADVVRKDAHLYFVRVGGCVVETLRISVVAIKACDEVADEWNLNHSHPFQS